MKLKTPRLTPQETEFLEIITRWSWRLEALTRQKAQVYLNNHRAQGLSSVLFLCLVLKATTWGNHPLSHDKFRGKDACNLLLLEADEHWEGRSIKYDGILYRLYDSYEDFCVDYSDYIVLQAPEFAEVILEKDYITQLNLLTRDDSNCYNEIVKILSLLGLKHE